MPFAATGGLGDVLGSLPSSIIEAGKGEVDVRVVMPLYRAVSNTWRAQMTKVFEGEIELAWRRQYCGIYSLVKDGVTYYFVDNKYYFDRDTLYGYMDEGERYAYFSKVAAELPMPRGRKYTLNFPVTKTTILDAKELSRLFDKEKFIFGLF